MTGLTIRLRAAGWWLAYRGYLAVLGVLAALRYLAVAAALLAHRAHTAVAAHGLVVADTLDAHDFTETTRPSPERYRRLIRLILSPKDFS